MELEPSERFAYLSDKQLEDHIEWARLQWIAHRKLGWLKGTLILVSVVLLIMAVQGVLESGLHDMETSLLFWAALIGGWPVYDMLQEDTKQRHYISAIAEARRRNETGKHRL